MERLKQAWGTIAEQLGKLSPSQKVLIGSLAIILLMALFLVSQYAAAPKMVPLVTGGTGEDQQRIAEFLEGRGVPYQTKDGRIVVAAERHYAVLAQLQQASALPADKKLLFPSLFDGQSWMRSRGELDQRYTIALGNELAQIIRHFPGVSDAAVMISVADQRAGLGSAARRPTAQVTVFTRTGTAIDQPTVDALADLVAGSVAGIEAGDVKIVDGTNRRRYRAGSVGDFYASTYLEQAAKVEERIQSKITEHLAPFIPNVIVSVNAIIDASRKESKTDSVLPKGEGTQALTLRESITTSSTTDSTTGAAEPGAASNVQMDISRGGTGGKSTTSSETVETEYENLPGRKTVVQLDAQGKPLKINVSVAVPRDYVEAILARSSAAGAPSAVPTDDEVRSAWDAERLRIEGMVRPLIETEAGSLAQSAAGAAAAAGNLVVTMIPVALASAGPGGGAGGTSAGGLLGGSSLLSSTLAKQIALGGLAAVALGLMLLMVKKAGKPMVLPTAEELVGVPPALEPGSDLIGEAVEGETAMLGIEVDDNELKTSKMLEQVAELVKTNPTSAASVFSKWLTPDD